MKQIPMLDLQAEYQYMKEDIDAAIGRCLQHQKWILGPEVRELEERLSEYLGVRHCVGASSGTEALVLSLRAMAIKLKGQEYFERSDEIITTPFTFTATGDAILRSGATPVFVDIDPKTYNIDPDGIREYLSSPSGEKVIGIVPVHLYGQACDMEAIMDIAATHGLFVLEDVAQAFGGRWRGRKLGAIGTAGAFSFFPSKNLGGFGDGGMISTDDDEIAELVRMLLRHGGRDKYNVEHIGYNARLDTLQAAVVLAKMKYVDEFNRRRTGIAGLYNEGLAGIPGLELPVAVRRTADEDTCHVYHQYTLRTEEREGIQAYLREMGVSTMVYYPYPLHRMEVFGSGRSRSLGSLGNAERSSEGVFSLPIEPLQGTEATQYVIGCIKEYFSQRQGRGGL